MWKGQGREKERRGKGKCSRHEWTVGRKACGIPMGGGIAPLLLGGIDATGNGYTAPIGDESS